MKKIISVAALIFMLGCGGESGGDSSEPKLDFVLALDGLSKNASGEYEVVNGRTYHLVLDLSHQNMNGNLQISPFDYAVAVDGNCIKSVHNFDTTISSAGACTVTATINDLTLGTRTASIKINPAYPAVPVTDFHLLSVQDYGNTVYLPTNSVIYLGASKNYKLVKTSGSCEIPGIVIDGMAKIKSAASNDTCKIKFTEQGGGSDTFEAILETISPNGLINASTDKIKTFTPVNFTAQNTLTGTVTYDWYFNDCGHAIQNNAVYKTKLINGGKTITFKPGFPANSCQIYVVTRNGTDTDVITNTFEIHNLGF